MLLVTIIADEVQDASDLAVLWQCGVKLVTGDFLDGSTIAPIATLALVGLLGTADDWLNARTGDGISATQKLLWQTVVAGVAAWQIQDTYQIDQLAVPFVGAVDIHPILFILIAALAVWASTLSGGGPGYAFYLQPDFSELLHTRTITGAVGTGSASDRGTTPSERSFSSAWGLWIRGPLV